jgi:hypothetical protein
MEFSMSSDATVWSCDISLRRESFMPRVPVPTVTIAKFGTQLTNKSLVEIWLRRAQAAILNPHVPQEEFYNKSTEELRNMTANNALEFSQNVVVVDLKDPTLTDLSFVDLPGMLFVPSVSLVLTVSRADSECRT